MAQEPSSLHNPYAGVPFAWQLTETVQDFLERLPPATTDWTPLCPWIYICNPFIRRVPRDQGENQLSKGNEDEAPTEEGSRLLYVTEGALERLHILADVIGRIEGSGAQKFAVAKAVEKERSRAALDILHLAHVGKVRTGKWMLFCQVADVNDIWETVAKATANNELGIAAKVAPRALDQDPRRERLVCIYTQDFADKADVRRVLEKLRELRLVDGRRRPIYYKPDHETKLLIINTVSKDL
ncbi:UPF0696 protein C11orf68 -like protein [Escovopsis weberi]|uniref:UPF0696 protein C11orf68-like protein n=1 Tax=Escovopsis weberi TaxID=150374 RepID=A0A0M9VSW2_ESCWE|nr:UPF0696 protein C11orf68 -like protein [Escovopsis weberi]